MTNIEDIQEVTRMAIQCHYEENGWHTVHNFPIGTKMRDAVVAFEKWKMDLPKEKLRLISADIIVDITVQGM